MHRLCIYWYIQQIVDSNLLRYLGRLVGSWLDYAVPQLLKDNVFFNPTHLAQPFDIGVMVVVDGNDKADSRGSTDLYTTRSALELTPCSKKPDTSILLDNCHYAYGILRKLNLHPRTKRLLKASNSIKKPPECVLSRALYAKTSRHTPNFRFSYCQYNKKDPHNTALIISSKRFSKLIRRLPSTSYVALDSFIASSSSSTSLFRCISSISAFIPLAFCLAS